MNFREIRARLIRSYGNFVFFPEDPEASKVVSTKAFTHLVIEDDITLYAPKAMEEQVERELEENYDVVYGEPELGGVYNVSPGARAYRLNFRYRDGSEILAKALRKPFEEEVEIIRNFSHDVADALHRALSELKLGMSAEEFRRILDCEFARAGADGFSFPTIVALGEESRFPYPRTSRGRIGEGMIVYLDAAPSFRGYPLNFSRVIFTEERRDWIEALERINAMYSRLGTRIMAGVRCNEADSLIREVGDFPHYSMVPSGGFYQPLAPGECVLEENMLATVVPSIYLKEGVIRVKRNVFVAKSRLEFLV